MGLTREEGIDDTAGRLVVDMGAIEPARQRAVEGFGVEVEGEEEVGVGVEVGGEVEVELEGDVEREVDGAIEVGLDGAGAVPLNNGSSAI